VQKERKRGNELNEQEIVEQSQLYCQDLYHQWRMLDFRGIMHVNMDSRINIPLEDVFVVPDVLPIVPEFETLEREEAPRSPNMRRFSRHEHKPYEESKHRKRREDFLNVLVSSQRRSLVILGDPGAGKTTLLRYLLLQLVAMKQGYPSALHAIPSLSNFTPIYIPLAAYASVYCMNSRCTLETFLPLLLKDYALEQYTDLLLTLMRRKQVFFLLDGLDELANTDLRRTVVGELMRFTGTHAENYFLVTSRIVGYKDTQLERPYIAYTIADFSEEQIRTFTEKWYPAYEFWVNCAVDSSYHQKRTQKEAEYLFLTTQRNPGVQRLAVNPLLLTILALIQRQGIELPAHRVELFDLCVSTLIDTWLRAKGYLESSRLNRNDLFKLLRPLAFWMHDKLAASTVPEALLQAQIHAQLKSRNMKADEDQIEQMMQSFFDTVRGKTGILIERGEKQYGFLHQTFQEYFAARELVVHKHWEKLIRKHVHDPHWREVILLAAGTIGILQSDEDGVTELVQEVILKARSCYEHWLHRDLLIAGLCLADDIGVSRNCEDIILNEILHLYLTSPFSSLRSNCEKVFSRWYGSRIAQEAQKLVMPFLSKQVSLIGNDEQEATVLAERTLFEHRILSHYQRLIQQHKHALEQIVRLQLLVILYRLERVDAFDVRVDEAALLCDVSWQIRKLAVSLLAELGFSQSDLIEVLLTALRDPHAEVRRAAAKALRERRKVTARITDALCYAQFDPDPGVRKAATNTLGHLKAGKGYHIDTGKSAQSGPISSSYVSRDHSTAHKNRPSTDAWLTLDNPKAEKRRRAIMRLVSSHMKEEQVLTLLKNIDFVNIEDDPNLKQAVNIILKQLAPVPSQSFEILQGLAHSDPDPYVREIAIIILGQLGNTQSHLSEVLHDLLWFDPDPYVREAGTVVLGQLGNVQPQVLETLQKLACHDRDPHVREAAVAALKQSSHAQQSNLDSLLSILADLETNPNTKTTMATIEQLGRNHPDIVQQLLCMVYDDGPIKDLVRKPAEVYRQQIYIEALVRNLQLLKYLGSGQPQVIDTLFTNLTSQNEDVRCMTIATLGRLGATDPHTVDVLIDMLSDPAETVRNEAVNVLGELGKVHHHVLAAMVASLKKNALVDKRAIADALRRSGCTQPFVIDALLSLLASSTSPNEPLEVILTSHPSDDRQAAVETLAYLGAGNDRVLQALLSTLDDLDLSVRNAAVSALARLGKGNVTVCQALLKTLEDKSPSVRQSVASALGQMACKNDNLIDALLLARQDADLHVRKAAVPALIQIGSDQQHVQDALRKDFTGSSLRVRRELALAFAQLRQVDPVFMPTLLCALHADDPSVQGNVTLALGKVGGNTREKINVCHALIEAFHHASASTLRSDILLALGKISDNDIIWGFVRAVLIKALDEPDSSVKYNAALSLARQGHYLPEVVSVLLLSLLDAEAPSRQEIITLLNRTAHDRPEVTDALLHALADADQSVREAAANALALTAEDEDRVAIGKHLAQLLEGYQSITEKQLTADPTIEATLSVLQRVMRDVL
jgi:HEAT repeat protein